MIRIIAIEGRGIISKIIECYTWSPFSHVAIQVGMNVWEATSPKVRRLSEQDFWNAYKDEAALVLRPIQYVYPEDDEKLVKWLDSHVGDDYSENALIRFLLRKKSPKDKECWVCSKLVFEAMAHIKRPLLQRIPSYKIVPAHIVMSPLLEEDRIVGELQLSNIAPALATA